MISNLDPLSIICAPFLFNNYIATSVKCLSDITINIYKNYDGL